MKALATQMLGSLLDSLRDLAPIVLVIAFFQLAVLSQPIPNLAEILWGTLLVVLGLTLFVQGLKLGLFPIGETILETVARVGGFEEKPGTGIAVQIDVEDAVGISHQIRMLSTAVEKEI